MILVCYNVFGLFIQHPSHSVELKDVKNRSQIHSFRKCFHSAKTLICLKVKLMLTGTQSLYHIAAAFASIALFVKFKSVHTAEPCLSFWRCSEEYVSICALFSSRTWCNTSTGCHVYWQKTFWPWEYNFLAYLHCCLSVNVCRPTAIWYLDVCPFRP